MVRGLTFRNTYIYTKKWKKCYLIFFFCFKLYDFYRVPLIQRFLLLPTHYEDTSIFYLKAYYYVKITVRMFERLTCVYTKDIRDKFYYSQKLCSFRKHCLLFSVFILHYDVKRGKERQIFFLLSICRLYHQIYRI